VDPPRPDDPPLDLVRAAAAGDADAWRALVALYHDRLRRMVAVRLDPRLTGRIDPSDVLQDAYIDAAGQLPDYVADPKYPLFLWLRLVTGHRLAKLHRFHLGGQVRDAAREVSLFRGALPEASSAALAVQLLGAEPGPATHAERAEQHARVLAAMNALEPTDREVLTLRHFEQLTTPQVARVLGISEAAAAKRFLRALRRLGDALGNQP
jgi:RNA polymerase sigma-70 factor (ECF subfamily)